MAHQTFLRSNKSFESLPQLVSHRVAAAFFAKEWLGQQSWHRPMSRNYGSSHSASSKDFASSCSPDSTSGYCFNFYSVTHWLSCVSYSCSQMSSRPYHSDFAYLAWQWCYFFASLSWGSLSRSFSCGSSHKHRRFATIFHSDDRMSSERSSWG